MTHTNLSVMFRINWLIIYHYQAKDRYFKQYLK